MNIATLPPSTRTRQELRSAVPSLDRFEPAPEPLALIPPPSPRQDWIPDVVGILEQNLRFEQLNEKITESYSQFAHLFQQEFDPSYGSTSLASTSPSWFSFGSFASRQAGLGMYLAGRTVELLEDFEDDQELEARCQELFPNQPDLEGTGTGRILAYFLLSLTGGALDPRTVVINLDRLAHLVAQAPGENLKSRLIAVAQTARNMLEDGNQRIFSELGVSAQAFCHFGRQQGENLTTDLILDQFSLSADPRPEQARAFYNSAWEAVLNGGDLPTDWESRFPSEQTDHRNLLVAGYALYHRAASVADPGRRDRTLQLAGILLAHREQQDTAQPAFTPGRVVPGEVDRALLMEIMTCGVLVPTRELTWSYSEFAERALPPRDGNLFTPRVTEYNWAHFRDRWPGILDFFQQVFERPGSVWPVPPSNPTQPLEESARQ